MTVLRPDSGLRPLVLAIAAGAAAEAAALALPVTAVWLLARAAGHPPLAALSVAIVGVRAFALARGGLRYGERLVGHDVALRALARLRGRLYDALVPLAPAGLPAFRRADLLRRMVGDSEAAQDLIVRCVMPIGGAAVVGAGAVGLCAALSPSAAVVLAAGLLVAGVGLSSVAALAHRSTAARLAPAHADVAVAAADLLDGAAELAAFSAEGEALRTADSATAALAGVERRDATTTSVITAALVAVHGCTTAAVTLVAVYAHAAAQLSGPGLAVVALTALASFEPVLALPEAARRLVEVRAAGRRVAACFDTPVPVTEPADPLPAPRRPAHVRARGLRARYPGSAVDAVGGVDLDLGPGDSVALVGASGAGKSTVLATLQRFVEPSGGTLTLNGAPLDAYAGDDVRAQIGGVAADAYVFQASVAENLRVGRPDATDADLRAVLARVRLDGWLDGLDAGLATGLGADGARMSGGQRRRLLLARALLAEPAVLLLDEPTEGVEDELAEGLLHDLLDAAGDATVLLVTHRSAGLDRMDRVVELG